ncbi:cation diffusion facilitator family transporter [Desulfacinum hydrothermale DSM 13146]|uniref:Cation diffusion facilitator family transporter n=1 Tax=Desulfacinum hydrothermale DSM 13146 TaxID=1121390 RepID=A0A1W1XBI9_9BACT|nr:cation diffusion facilitator family transporter [Desulfacinum hydrothermale]SMC21223.1 cation diffusion facilitator family transporter [Desulfacinum hydrothermale DSM 13146]
MERQLFRQRLLAVSLSVTVGALLMLLKFYIFHLTRSTAVLSDALESIINVIASGFALWSIVLSAKPPDADHPYGHGKIEYFSAGFEGALIVIAAVGIFGSAWKQLGAARPLPHLDQGLLLLVAASLINLGLGVHLIRVGKRTQSIPLVADGTHVLTDVATSAGVILGLVLVKWTGWYWLDGAVAILVGAHILYSGSRLLRESFSRLMDASDPDLLAEIGRLLSSRRKENWIDVHRLRAWRSGRYIYVDFHLILPRDLTIHEAHQEVEELEQAFRDRFGEHVEVLVHIDACRDPECPICSRQKCKQRQAPLQALKPWDQAHLTTEFRKEADS